MIIDMAEIKSVAKCLVESESSLWQVISKIVATVKSLNLRVFAVLVKTISMDKIDPSTIVLRLPCQSPSEFSLGSANSDHGVRSSSNRKHPHRGNVDPSSYNNPNKTMAKIISSGTYEEYVNHVLATHAQYTGYTPGMFPPTNYPMGYDPTAYYGMGYDHRAMGLPMHSGTYEAPMDMYLPQSTASISSRSRNPTEYEQEINAFLRHTSTSGTYSNNDSSAKSHGSHRRHRDEKDYHHKSSSRHRSRSREHRR